MVVQLCTAVRSDAYLASWSEVRGVEVGRVAEGCGCLKIV